MKTLLILIFAASLSAMGAACVPEQSDDDTDIDGTPQPDFEPGMDPQPGMNPGPQPGCDCVGAQICQAGACVDVALPQPGPEINTEADPGCAGQTIAFVSGLVIDENSNPVVGAKAQSCMRVNPTGQLLCLQPGDTGADGTFSVAIPDSARCVDEVTSRVLQPLANRATQYCLNPLPQSTILQVEEPIVLYSTEPATTVPSGAGTVVFADGMEIDVDPALLFSDITKVAAGKVDPSARGLCFLEGEPTPDALYTFSPEADVVDGTFPIRVPNDKGLAAGAKVDLFVLGGLDCHLADGSLVEEAHWEQYGTGTVDPSGAFIASDAGSHLPCMTWFGYQAQ